MRSFALAILASAAAAAPMGTLEYEFVQYIAKFGKSYKDTNEYNLRFQRFMKRDQEIKEIMANETTSVHGHNFLSDYTAQEVTRMLGLKNMAKVQRPEATFTAPEGVALPVSWNWVTAGNYVNPVQDQGQCGSCWAFSATAALESAYAIKHNVLYKLSEQNFVSCSFLYGNLGCNGGLYNYAWNYSQTHPIESEANYPYTSGTTMKSGSCLYNQSLGIFGATGHVVVGTDTNSIMTAIYQQPQSVSVEADTAYFQSYTSGVLTNAAACGTNLDHAIVAVGWGVDPTAGGYYIVRNSWGTSWGQGGYVNIGQAAYPGICGINMDVEYPTVA
jgi:C1A family cysteine protease